MNAPDQARSHPVQRVAQTLMAACLAVMAAVMTLVLHRRDGVRTEVPVRCRIDTAEELSIHQAGGVLQRFAQDFLAAAMPRTLQATT